MAELIKIDRTDQIEINETRVVPIPNGKCERTFASGGPTSWSTIQS
jgi:hypothetical protein